MDSEVVPSVGLGVGTQRSWAFDLLYSEGLQWCCGCGLAVSFEASHRF
jgi:hypothetical protein